MFSRKTGASRFNLSKAAFSPRGEARLRMSYYFLIKFFNQKGSAFGVTDSVILIKSRNRVS